MTKAELDELYVRVPAAGLECGLTSGAVYSALQRGILDGICESGKWYVERASIARYLAARARVTTAQPTAAA